MKSPLSEITDEHKAELARTCWRSPGEFCRILLADWFPTPMPWFHRGILALLQGKYDWLLDFGNEDWRDASAAWTPKHLEKILTNFIEEGSGKPIFKLVVDEEGNPKLEVDVRQHLGFICPRGSSKTTLVNASNLMDIEYKVEDFFLYISESGGHAERQLGTIKTQLEDNDGAPENELLNFLFGNHKPSRQSPLKWTEEYIETLQGVAVGAVGRGGQVRGFGKNAKRPGKIVYDDLEDQDSVLSDTQRKKDNSWFWRAARPAKRKHTGKDIVLGTLLHTDAILNKVIKSKEFTTIRFGAIDRQGEALWDWWMTLDQIEELRLSMAEAGELGGFYLEYMSEYRDEDVAMFPGSKLIYQHREGFVAKALVMDPAISDKRKSAMVGFAVVGITSGGHKHVIDVYGERAMDPAAQIEKYFELHFKHFRGMDPALQRHGIEAMAYQQALLPMIRTMQAKKSQEREEATGLPYGQDAFFEVLPIFHGRTAKTTRIKGILKPLVWAGNISFEQNWPDLHTQMTDFPNGALVDLPDVVAMAVAMLDPYVLLNLQEEAEDGSELPDMTADTMPPLESVLGDFRSAP